MVECVGCLYHVVGNTHGGGGMEGTGYTVWTMLCVPLVLMWPKVSLATWCATVRLTVPPPQPWPGTEHLAM